MRRLAGLALAIAATTTAAAQPTPQPKAQAIAPGVWLIPGGFPPKRQPDGNTVIFEAPMGLVVMDTGRHAWHRQAILDFASSRRKPVAAIVNSHWHLDHVSGNPALKAAYPRVRVYASRAIDLALSGFLAKSAADAPAYLAPGKLPPETQEDIRNDLATIQAGEALKPDIAVDASGERVLAGRRMAVNLARDAATAGDVWLYDRRSGVAAVGDLVTLPAPFLDTACPQGWRAALGAVWATPFKIAIPGHGAPMSRDQFALYRSAFDSLVDCAASARGKAGCAADWTISVGPLLGDAPDTARRAQGMTEAYVDVLRAHGGKSASCAA